MTNPLVSVIVAVHNGEQYIAEALNSIFAQTYPPYEVIVVDGYSTDDTEKIAKSYSQVKFIRQPGKGIPDAYNFGIQNARGDLIAFLSHDDLWAPNKLEVQVNYLMAHLDIQYTVAKVKFFLDNGQTIPSGFRPELLEGEHIGRIMETLVVRKSLFEHIGMFNTELTIAEDVDWYARASDHHIASYIVPEVLLYKRVHNSNTSLNALGHSQNLLQALRTSIRRKRDLKGLHPEQIPIS